MVSRYGVNNATYDSDSVMLTITINDINIYAQYYCPVIDRSENFSCVVKKLTFCVCCVVVDLCIILRECTVFQVACRAACQAACQAACHHVSMLVNTHVVPSHEGALARSACHHVSMLLITHV